MGWQRPAYCINCGLRLAPDSHPCTRCGAPRWQPPPRPAGSPPGAAGAPHLGPLPWLYAAGAVLFLIWATQTLALFVAPAGRAQLIQELAQQGFPAGSRTLVAAIYAVVLIGWLLVAAGLHATAFYGLRGRRRRGWLAALVIAGAWSLVGIGIPVLLRLIDPALRREFRA